MKFFTYLLLFALLPAFSFADAGISIGRDKAECHAVAKGMDKLTDYEFFKNMGYEGQDRSRLTDSTHRMWDNQEFKIYYGDEGRRGAWDGPIKILIRNKNTQQLVDSIILVAEGYNLTINFTGAENNKVKYTIDKSKSAYPYELYTGENVDSSSTAKRNRLILISLSVIGFLTLAFMFYKKRNTTTTDI